jgi:hypothetical protein
MLLQHLFEDDGYKTYRVGQYLRIGVWFNAQTGATIDAWSKNHAEIVASEPRKFGISAAELSKIRRDPDFDKDDWNEPVIKLANLHHWVRVKAEGQATNLELNLQSTIAPDALKAARHFAAALSPTVIYVDLEVRDYENVWFTKLEGDSMERYLKTGHLPAG